MVFSVATHAAPFPRKIRHTGFWYAYTHPPSKQLMHHHYHHHSSSRCGPMRQLRLQEAVPGNAPCGRCGGSGFALMPQTRGRQPPLKRQPVFSQGRQLMSFYRQRARSVARAKRLRPHGLHLDLRHAPIDEQLDAGDVTAVI
jgi:hypothetical protein